MVQVSSFQFQISSFTYFPPAIPYAANALRTCYAERCHVSCSTYAAAPGALCAFRFATGAGQLIYDGRPASLCSPSVPKFTSRCFVLPPKPPATGGCTPRLEPKKKLFIQLHSAILPHPAASYAVRCPFPVSSFSFLHKFSFVRRSMGVGCSRHQRHSARRHLLAPFRPGSTRTSFRQAEVRSQTPPRAASYDPQAPATGDVRRALSQERNCAVCTLRKLRVHPSQILPCLRGMGGGYYRHVSASAVFAFRSPANQGGGADVIFAALKNIIA